MPSVAPPAWQEGLRVLALFGAGAAALRAGQWAARRSSRCLYSVSGLAVILVAVCIALTSVAMQDRFAVYLVPFGGERVPMCVAALALLGVGWQMRLPSIRRPLLATLIALAFVVIASYVIGPLYWCLFAGEARANFPRPDGGLSQSTGTTCAPASGAMLLHRYGIRASEGELAQLAHTSPVLGTFEQGIASAPDRAARPHGLRAHIRRIFYDEAQRLDRPCVVFIDSPEVGGHALLAERFDDTAVTVVDPLRDQRQRLAKREFTAMWDGGIVWLAPE